MDKMGDVELTDSLSVNDFEQVDVQVTARRSDERRLLTQMTRFLTTQVSEDDEQSDFRHAGKTDMDEIKEDLAQQARLRLQPRELELGLDKEVSIVKVTDDSRILLVHGFSVSVVEDNLVISTLSHFFKVQSIAATNEFIFTSEGKSPAITFGIKALDNLVAQQAKEENKLSHHINVWSNDTFRRLHRIQVHTKVIPSLYADNEFVVSGSHDKQFKVWSVVQEKLVHQSEK